jgi:hypothetical protein
MMFLTTIVACLFTASVATAEDAAADEALKVNGYVDVYYAYNFNNPPVATPLTPPPVGAPLASATTGNNKYRAFDQYHNDINVSLAELLFTKKSGEVTMKVALDYGRLVEVMSPADEVTKNITQATITYNPKSMESLAITVGKMITHMGAEGMKAGDNWQYSRSLLFNYGAPFWHEGAAVAYAFVPGKFTGTFFLYNNSVGLIEDNRQKHYGLQFIATPIDGLTLAYNGISGREAQPSVGSIGALSYNGATRTIHDLNGTYKINDAFAAQFDFIYGQAKRGKVDGSNGSWTAFNVAAKWTSGNFSLSPRFGMFDDSDALVVDTTVAGGQKLKTYTLTAKYNLGNGLETTLEYRMDKSDKDVFADDSGTLNKDSQSTILAAAIFTF